jgi:hypothetical protein
VAGKGERKPIEVWKFNRQVPSAVPGTLLRIQASSPFLLHWTNDEWLQSSDTNSNATEIGIHFVDVGLHQQQKAAIRFTFHWLEGNRWESKDYVVEVKA